MGDGPIFVVGCPRSGTTLLRDLLRSHPRLTFTPETHFVPLYHAGYGDPRNTREALRLGRRILALPRVKRWGLDLTPADFAADRSFAAALARFYGAWGRRDGKPRVGDKTPQYVTVLPLLHQLFPEARFLHIVRDGRDVASSWLATRFEPRNLFQAALGWKRYVSAGLAAAAALPPRALLMLTYERLLDDPAAVMREVCAFVGEDFDPAVLTPSVRPLAASWPVTDAAVQPPPGRITAGRVGTWRERLSSSDRVLFESIAGELLGTLGYPLEGRTRPVPATERLYWRAHQRLARPLAVVGDRPPGWVIEQARLTALERAPAAVRRAFQGRIQQLSPEFAQICGKSRHFS